MVLFLSSRRINACLTSLTCCGLGAPATRRPSMVPTAAVFTNVTQNDGARVESLEGVTVGTRDDLDLNVGSLVGTLDGSLVEG